MHLSYGTLSQKGTKIFFPLYHIYKDMKYETKRFNTWKFYFVGKCMKINLNYTVEFVEYPLQEANRIHVLCIFSIFFPP